MATKTVKNPKQMDAKLFWIGRSQAVRLPKAFRFEGDRVRITRMGQAFCSNQCRWLKRKRSRSCLRGWMPWMRIQSFLKGGNRTSLPFVSISSELQA